MLNHTQKIHEEKERRKEQIKECNRKTENHCEKHVYIRTKCRTTLNYVYHDFINGEESPVCRCIESQIGSKINTVKSHWNKSARHPHQARN